MQPLIHQIRHQVPVADWSYLQGLRDGSLTLEQFQSSQIQFRFAVEAFSISMQRLRDRVDDEALGIMLDHNLADERGRGDPSATHDATFRRFLHGLGVPSQRVASTARGTVVHTFITVLDDTCAQAPIASALACLGMIEDLFAEISSSIGDGVITRGWSTPDALVHYATHETLDLAHAAAFYEPLSQWWPAQDVAIHRGLQLGHLLMYDLYAGLAHP